MIKQSVGYIKNLIKKITDDEMVLRASGVSFYILLAFFPFIIILFLLSSLISDNVSRVILDSMDFFPQDVGHIVTQLITNTGSGIAVIVSMVLVSLWTLSGALVTVSKSLNAFYGIHNRRNFIVNRLMAMVWALLLLVVIVAVMMLVVFGNIVWRFVYAMPFVGAGRVVGGFVLAATVVMVISVMYMSVVNIHLGLGQVIKGAVAATLLWIGSSYGFRIYVSNFSRYHLLYGSIGGVVILIIWIYITAVAILLGGEINAIENGGGES